MGRIYHMARKGYDAGGEAAVHDGVPQSVKRNFTNAEHCFGQNTIEYKISHKEKLVVHREVLQ